jgi:predicted hydrocarbon binding protein
MPSQIAEAFRASIRIDADRSRITIGGCEVAFHSDKFATRIFKGLEDVLGVESAAEILKDSAAQCITDLLANFLRSQAGWSKMAVDERLIAILEIYKLLGYGAVKLEKFDGGSTTASSDSSYVAISFLQNNKNWNWPLRKTPFCSDMCGYLQAAFALATDKNLESYDVVEKECRSQGKDVCIFQVEAK